MFKYLLIFICIISFNIINAQENKAGFRIKEYNLNKNLAIQGYDPVAYFQIHKAKKGNKAFAVSHQGVTYYFVSAMNKSEFLKSPSSYEPQFGGWCAYAMGNTGEKVEIDPETFKIINGQLFLFYNKFLNNTLKSWNKNESNLMQKAYVNWSKITNK